MLITSLTNRRSCPSTVNAANSPAYIDQIDFPYFKIFSEKKIVPEKPGNFFSNAAEVEKAIAKYKVGAGAWLSFLPLFNKDIFDDDVVEEFKIYLVNHTGESF